LKIRSLFFVTSLLSSSALFAGSFIDQAEIIAVNPVINDIVIREPYDECYLRETYEADSDGTATNEIMAGILGGLIGNQFGEGDGKDALTLAGTLLGASLAHEDEIAKSKTGRIFTDEVCERKYRVVTERRISHYRVEYFYHGQTFTYITKYQPTSNSLSIDVTVTPR
jgi:uncharacterized protein YcfJ